MDGPREFEAFVVSSAPRLTRSARLLARRTADAEDLVQETLVRLYPHWNGLRDRAAAEAYAHRTLVRLSRRHSLRAYSRYEVLANQPDVEDEREPPATELRAVVWQAMRCLPMRQREVIALRYLLDLSIEQVAKAMKCSNGTVKSQTSKALANLKETLAQQDPRLTTMKGE